MSPRSSLPAPAADWAVFLDVDGTLIEIATTPDAVRVEARVVPILTRLGEALAGAVALVSGRPLADLDRLLDPLRLPAAGLHGLERRNARGQVFRRPRAADELNGLRRPLSRFADTDPGLILEDKGLTLALHYRNALPREAEARRLVAELVAPFRKELHVQEGKMVLEVKPRGIDKGTVIEAFMTETPFATRKPVFIGDDVTDEDGFEAVNRFGGHSIRIGEAESTAARWRLDSVAALLDWLEGIPTALGTGAQGANGPGAAA